MFICYHTTMITAIVLMMVFLVASEIYAANEWKPQQSSKKESKEKKPSTINWRVVRYILFIICIALLANLMK